MEMTTYYKMEPNEMETPSNKSYLRQSKYFLALMGLAMLYCIAYGIVLIQEFNKMGILNLIVSSK